MAENTKIASRVKSSDRYDRKVHCPQCRARLMDIHADDLEYKAVLAQIGSRMSFDFSVKCPKCRSLVGISFEHQQIQIAVLGSVSA